VEAETGADGPNDGNERIVDGHLADGIAGEQFVIKRETHGADADEQKEPQQSQRRECWQCAIKEQTAGHEDGPANRQTVARAHEYI